jgi:hypothetical protein
MVGRCGKDRYNTHPGPFTLVHSEAELERVPCEGPQLEGTAVTNSNPYNYSCWTSIPNLIRMRIMLKPAEPSMLAPCYPRIMVSNSDCVQCWSLVAIAGQRRRLSADCLTVLPGAYPISYLVPRPMSSTLIIVRLLPGDAVMAL